MNTPTYCSSYRSAARLALPAFIAGAALLIAACASTPAPTAEVAVSTEAVAHAVSAGGPQWAPAEMRTAREKLDRANLAMASKDYKNAKTLAQEAQVDAQLAEAKARSANAGKAAGELQEDRRVLRDELDRKANK
jgi:Domain of unknown function (DUF4398)